MQEIIESLTKRPDLANALAAVASAVIAISALAVSIIALFVARATLKHQQRHDVLSVKPLPSITLGDYENKLSVRLRNHGSGPLVIKRILATRSGESRPALIDWMPDLRDGIYWAAFVADVSDRAVLPGDGVTLLELDDDPTNADFAAARDDIRGALASINVRVEYSDIYDSPVSRLARDLTWFGRLLQTEGHKQARTGTR